MNASIYISHPVIVVDSGITSGMAFPDGLGISNGTVAFTTEIALLLAADY